MIELTQEIAETAAWVAKLDAAYHERNQLVSFLSRLYPSHLARDPESPEWPVVCVHGPTGQMSWHVHETTAHDLFGHLTDGPNDWDGTTTDTKYERLADLRG